MNKFKFEKAIKEFVELGYPSQEKVLCVVFKFKFMGGRIGEGITFSGEYVFSSGMSLPCDFRKIGKSKCRELVDYMKLFYKDYLLESRKPCNVIQLKIWKGSDSIEYSYV